MMDAYDPVKAVEIALEQAERARTYLSEYEVARRIGRALVRGAANDCLYCVRVNVGGGPSHEASPLCRSGRRAHCTCDTCF